jgi:hypothetical protein
MRNSITKCSEERWADESVTLRIGETTRKLEVRAFDLNNGYRGKAKRTNEPVQVERRDSDARPRHERCISEDLLDGGHLHADDRSDL